MPQAQVCVAVKFPFWKHICSTSYVSAILVSKRISNKRTFQEELHQLWLVGTCTWTWLGPYERCKMSCNIILLSLNAVGNKHDQTVLCSQAMVFWNSPVLNIQVWWNRKLFWLGFHRISVDLGLGGFIILVLDISTGYFFSLSTVKSNSASGL